MSQQVLSGFLARLRTVSRREQAQGLVEYALILVLVAIVVIIILTLLGGTLANVFSDVVAGI